MAFEKASKKDIYKPGEEVVLSDEDTDTYDHVLINVDNIGNDNPTYTQ